MRFKPENELEKALVKAVKDSGTAADFARMLLASDLLVLGSVAGHEEAQDKFALAPGGQITLVPGEKNGEKFLPVFSSVTRMQAYVSEEAKYLAIKGRDLLELTRGAPVTLNPGSDYGKEFTAEEVAQLLNWDQGAREPRMSEPKIMIGEVDFPMDLVNATTALFQQRPDIANAWMIRVTFADRAREPHPLIGVEFDSEAGGGLASLMPQIEQMAEAAVPGMVFDVQQVDRKRQTGMADALLQVPPYYTRGQSLSGATIN